MMKKVLPEYIVEGLGKVVSQDRIIFNAPLKEYTTIRIGGMVDLMIFPKDLTELTDIFKLLSYESIPVFVMGKGSNIIVSDKGFRGAVVNLSKGFTNMECDEQSGVMKSGCGVTLSKMAVKAYECELSGLEFASGIPGTFGGAIYMNAGAYGWEMKDIVTEVEYMDYFGNVKTINAGDCAFGYRNSIFKNMDVIITGATIHLSKGDKSEIKKKMSE